MTYQSTLPQTTSGNNLTITLGHKQHGTVFAIDCTTNKEVNLYSADETSSQTSGQTFVFKRSLGGGRMYVQRDGTKLNGEMTGFFVSDCTVIYSDGYAYYYHLPTTSNTTISNDFDLVGGSSQTSDHKHFITEQRSWHSKTAASTPRYRHAAFSRDGFHTILAGQNASSTLIASAERYYYIDNSWASITAYATNTTAMTATSIIKGYSFLFGGEISGGTHPTTNSALQFGLQTYISKTANPQGADYISTFTPEYTYTASPSAYGSETIYKTEFYRVAGYINGTGVTNTNYVYSVVTDAWTSKTALSYSTYGATAFSWQNGGQICSGNSVTSCYEYFTFSNAWTSKTSHPTSALNGQGGSIWHDIAMSMGGVNQNCYFYQTLTNIWSSTISVPSTNASCQQASGVSL